jgi:hypothetical protein
VAKIDPLERLDILSKEAFKVLEALSDVSEMLAQYNLTGLSKWDWTKVLGVKLEWGDRDQDLPAGELPIGQAVYTIKAKIKKIRDRYLNTFPEELVYLSQNKLDKFECLPAIGLLNNPDVVDSVHKAQEAMLKRYQEIMKKVWQVSNMGTASSANNRAQGALYSLENARIIDSISKEEQILRDAELQQLQELQKEKKEMARYAYTVMTGDRSSTPIGLNAVVMGLTPAPVDAVSKKVSDFNNWLLAKQAPYSSNFCNRRRTALTNDQLTRARVQGAEEAGKLERAAAETKVFQKGKGLEVLASYEYKMLENRFKKSIRQYDDEEKKRKVVFLENKFASLKRSLSGCETSEGVKRYLKDMEKVITDLKSLAAEDQSS